MTNNRFLFYWQTDPDWYYVDEDRYPYLTDKAPEAARESYRQYIERYTRLGRIEKKNEVYPKSSTKKSRLKFE